MGRSKSKKNLSERALGIRVGGYGGLWGTERRPGEPQGGLQELQSYDPWSLSSDYEPARSRGQPPKSSQGASLRARMKVKVAQKSSTEPFESSENDLKIKNVNVHKTIEKSMKIIDF